MKPIWNIFIVLLPIIFVCKPAHSQSPREFEHHLKKLMSQIDDLSCCPNDDDDSALSEASSKFNDYLFATLPKIPESLTMKMHVGGLWIATSSDHKIRSWAWDTHTGGSMPEIGELIEFSTSKGIQVIDPNVHNEGNQDSWIDTILTVHTQSSRTYYLPISGWQGDGMHVGEQVNAYEIKDTTLNTEVPLFRTKKGNLTNSISYYSDRESANRNRFRLSPDGSTFFVPVARFLSKHDRERGYASLTSKSLRYEFDGEHFVYRGVTRAVKQ